MVYCNLKGGISNMMFQIAAAKSLAIDNNTDSCHPNLLSHLNYLNVENTYNPSMQHANDYMEIFRDIKTNPIDTNLVYNYPFHYADYNIKNNNFIINGFYQSEKYFQKHRKEILEMFKITNNIQNIINTKYDEIIHDIYNHIYTSIHVRRGDYIKFSDVHYLLPIEYYNEAIFKLDSRTDKFIIFSDDIKWCKNNFIGDKFIFIEDEKDYIEIYLMSMCDNHIIANSSFSWWGAWLNNKEDKMVIAPKKWFTNDNMHDTSDIIPENWIKI